LKSQRQCQLTSSEQIKSRRAVDLIEYRLGSNRRVVAAEISDRQAFCQPLPVARPGENAQESVAAEFDQFNATDLRDVLEKNQSGASSAGAAGKTGERQIDAPAAS
jgi:hypothetical protein